MFVLGFHFWEVEVALDAELIQEVLLELLFFSRVTYEGRGPNEFKFICELT